MPGRWEALRAKLQAMSDHSTYDGVNPFDMAIDAMDEVAEELANIDHLAADYLAARLVLAAHPDNDSTKRFDRKLAEVEATETALMAALVAQGYEIEETN